MATMQWCTGEKRDGGRCKNRAVPGTDRCPNHGSAEQWAALKAEALDLLREGVGTNEAAHRVGVSPSQLSRWSTDAGIVPDRAAQTEAAHEGMKLKWAQRRDEAVDRFSDTIFALLDRITDADPQDVRHLVWSVATLTDKAQVVSGGVTSRHEVLDAQRRRERVEQLQDDLAERRAARDGTTGG